MSLVLGDEKSRLVGAGDSLAKLVEVNAASHLETWTTAARRPSSAMTLKVYGRARWCFDTLH